MRGGGSLCVIVIENVKNRYGMLNCMTFLKTWLKLYSLCYFVERIWTRLLITF
jgi:hypothetical protein